MVERLYPGVYVSEITFSAKPIDGVPAASAHTDTGHASVPSPDWTEHNPSDPGVTLAQLFAWVGESLLFRSHTGPIDHATHSLAGSGVVNGLAVDTLGGATNDVAVTPGVALDAAGRPIEAESPAPAHHAHKP
jgi:hypothetical protein